MGSTVDIIARLKFSGDQFSRDHKRLFGDMEKEAERTSTRVGTAFGKMKGLMIGAVAGFGISEIASAGKRALDYASSLGEVSQQLGVTTDDLQIYRYAATQVGIEQEAMDKSLSRLTRTIGQAAQGGKAQARVFKDLGIDVRNTNGSLKTAGQLMPEIAAALGKIPEPAARAAKEVELFGKEGQRLDTLLSGGRDQIDNLSNAARDLGIVLSSKQIQSADEAADKLESIKTVLSAKFAGVVSDNADSIIKMADAIDDLIDGLP
ncbi:MAG: phage tail tape measure protein, partial [Gammaproteobacteria bacterium]